MPMYLYATYIPIWRNTAQSDHKQICMYGAGKTAKMHADISDSDPPSVRLAICDHFVTQGGVWGVGGWRGLGEGGDGVGVGGVGDWGLGDSQRRHSFRNL